MQQKYINEFLAAVGNNVTGRQLLSFRQKLEEHDDSWVEIYARNIPRLKNPKTALLLMILFAGPTYIGETEKTILAWFLICLGTLTTSVLFGYLIFFGVGFWWIIETLEIRRRTERHNGLLLGL